MTVFVLLEHDFADFDWVGQLDFWLHPADAYAPVVSVGGGYLAVEVDVVGQHRHVPVELLEYFYGFGSADKFFGHVLGG